MTFKYTAALAALVLFAMLAPGIAAPAGQTNTLESLKAAYGNDRLAIAMAAQQRREDSQKQYGKALDALLASLKQKGDLKTYLIVETEKKRFASEEMSTDVTNSFPALVPAVQSYETSLMASEAEQFRQTSMLCRKYVTALDGLIVTLMKADRIEDAKAVQGERDRAVAEIQSLGEKLPPEAQLALELQWREDVDGAKVFRGHHYLFVAEKRSWHEAKRVCEEMRGHLVTIACKEENDFVKRLAQRKNVWVGCTDEAKRSDWRWVDGARMTYTDWCKGEPSPERGEHYLGLLLGEKSYGWNDYEVRGSSVVVGYICEWDQ